MSDDPDGAIKPDERPTGQEMLIRVTIDRNVPWLAVARTRASGQRDWQVVSTS